VRRAIETLWYSESPTAAAARVVLAPAAAAYRVATGLRNAAYDRGILVRQETAIPVVSIGNLSVGGSGKTPVAAWFAREFADRGARPALVLRGYGGDEPRVHALLNPQVPVFVNPDRVAAVREAASGGHDVAILDDAFQHRRIARLEDIVLVSADQWREPLRLLPAGPWRERLDALSRASFIIVTRKAASRASAEDLMHRLAALRATGNGAVASLQPAALHDAVSGAQKPLLHLKGASVLAVAGIGDPESFAGQLRGMGARVELRRYPDHHSYSQDDVDALVNAAGEFDHICCTLKDAVKLGPRWPREGQSLWYVSLRCEIEVGLKGVTALIDRVLAARPGTPGKRR
jgi:tetraacyldisaccharide 4'-kinase